MGTVGSGGWSPGIGANLYNMFHLKTALNTSAPCRSTNSKVLGLIESILGATKILRFCLILARMGSALEFKKKTNKTKQSRLYDNS